MVRMRQDTAMTMNPLLPNAVDEICGKLKPSNEYIAIIFFASTNYDFPALSAMLKERFPNCEVIGATTSGEIIKGGGFINHSITVTALACNRTWVSGVFIKAL